MAETIKYKCTDLGGVKACYDKSQYEFVNSSKNGNDKVLYEKRKNGKKNKIGTIKFDNLRTVKVDIKPLNNDKPRQLDMSFYGDVHDNIFCIRNANRFNADFSHGGSDMDSYFEKNCHHNSLKGAEFRGPWATK